jgi:uncharacterized protein YbaR (Trm112 family)
MPSEFLSSESSFLLPESNAELSNAELSNAELPDGSLSFVPPKFFELLVCPLMKCPLYYDAETQELVSREAGLAYPIRNDIPVLIPEEARLLESS